MIVLKCFIVFIVVTVVSFSLVFFDEVQEYFKLRNKIRRVKNGTIKEESKKARERRISKQVKLFVKKVEREIKFSLSQNRPYLNSTSIRTEFSQETEKEIALKSFDILQKKYKGIQFVFINPNTTTNKPYEYTYDKYYKIGGRIDYDIR